MAAVTTSINGKNCEFELHTTGTNSITLACNNWSILVIGEKGLYLCDHVGETSNLPLVEGKIKVRTHHPRMHESYSAVGGNDVALRLQREGTVLYVRARRKNGDEQILLYIDKEGLYLWMDAEHQKNSYKCSKDNTILFIG